jgi:hypothetical protein
MEQCKDLEIKKKINATQQPLVSLNWVIWINQHCTLTADTLFRISVSFSLKFG